MSYDTATDSLRFSTFEAYLHWEVQQPIRYELHDGYVVAMAGAFETHNRIADNVALLLNQHYGLRGRCHAFRAEMKLRVGELKSRYPDVFVACDKPGDRRFFDDAGVVVEVVSPEVAWKDLVEAPVEYTRLARLEQYIVIDSRKRAAWSHLRQSDARFVLVPAEAEQIDLPFENLVLRFDDLYAGTTLDTDVAWAVDDAEGTVKPAVEPANMAGSVVIAVYKPRPGKEAELATLVRNHVPDLRAVGLVTDRAPIAAVAADGTIVEVFEWVSEDAIAGAHTHPVVQEMWKKFEAACWYETPANVPDLQRMFVSLTPLAPA